NYDPYRAAQYNIDKAVWIAGRIVEVSNPDQTWMTVQPFLGLLERLGADAFGYDLESIESGEFQDPHSKFMFSFRAPDEVMASHIETAIQTYLEKLPVISDANLPPWKDDAQNFGRAFAGKSLLNKHAVDSTLGRWQSMFDSMSNWPDRDSVPAYVEMPPKRLAVRRCGAFRRNGLDFEFENLAFENEPLGLYALIAYLEVNGCTDIDIRYEREKKP
ncbi:MAG: hypothetical protein K8I30_10090, partial [Anaerolineae bacterium]|nr:hypothetical protein [Anaerolineae bacterium]